MNGWDGDHVPLEYKETSDSTWCATHKRKKLRPANGAPDWECNVCAFLKRHATKKEDA